MYGSRSFALRSFALRSFALRSFALRSFALRSSPPPPTPNIIHSGKAFVQRKHKNIFIVFIAFLKRSRLILCHVLHVCTSSRLNRAAPRPPPPPPPHCYSIKTVNFIYP